MTPLTMIPLALEGMVMVTTTSFLYISAFRNQVVAWLLLFILISSFFVPSFSFAQQPTAQVKAWTGSVLVSGQTITMGMVLHAGDTLQTGSAALVIVELSDGSTIHLGANTQVTLADLAQTATGGRVSVIKLLAGRVRALLAAAHQKPGSAFTIETPNAQIGVKFSQPDVEVSYDPAKQETVGIAHTVELIAINLLTNEKIIVPVGSTVIIVGALVKIAAGTAASMIAREAGQAAATTATGTTSAATAGGIGTGTVVAIGAGIAAAGGVAAIVSSSSSGSETNTNTGCYQPPSWVDGNIIPIPVCHESIWGAGRAYWLALGWGFPTENSEADARANQPYISQAVTLNGIPLSSYSDPAVECCSAPWWQVVSYFCTGTLASGDYTIIGTSFNGKIGQHDVITRVLRVR